MQNRVIETIPKLASQVAMQDRQQHHQEVQVFLQQHFSNELWELTLPNGTGNETYFAHCKDHSYFVKLGVEPTKYRVVASIGLTPQVLAAGSLGDGTSIIVQPYIAGKRPSQRDYHNRLEQFASAINLIHHSAEVKQALPEASSHLYGVVALESLARVQQKWERHKALVPSVAAFVDESLDYLRRQVMDFQGTGLIASHNDICNANWLISPDGKLYLIDLESMSLDDPAVDIGATLWWYYPPRLRKKFLAKSGYINDKAFEKRMKVRMAMHCLNITLPREQSLDGFDSASYAETLTDFRAILAGRENPEGYDD
ncbi:MAG TPA: phosphotransferase [Anaerolineales bacterium]|jgi:thiamine kinase-like enzyme